ncbi:MAG: permease [Peptococcaceae bacterium]|nr:permease [Peptococcaceae bacterium]
MDYLFKVLLSGYHEILEYLSAHVLTCLVPAFFIAGGIAVVVSTGAVLKYFGPTTKKYISYGVASVSGTVLAVCSCTVLPLFAGIYRKGAGLGPAVTFLFAGPAINLLAIVLTARKLGFDLGAGRAIGAVLFSIIIGLIMAAVFRKEEQAKAQAAESASGFAAGIDDEGKPAGQLLAFFGIQVAILVIGTAQVTLVTKLGVIVALLVALGVVLVKWFSKEEVKDWLIETFKLVKLIFPILLVGVFVAGALKVIIPEQWIAASVGGNGILANLIASVVGALMYFSTLTEVPIVKMLVDLGMGRGPALALLLAGPALSLPNMLVVRNVIGTKKTLVYVGTVVLTATVVGYLFGWLVG